MNFEALHAEIQQALRSDLRRARRLVERYERAAAKDGDPMQEAMASFERAQYAHVAGQLRRARDGYARARDSFRRLGKRRHVHACEIGAVQVHALRGDAPGVRRSAARLRRLADGAVAGAAGEIALGSAYESLGDERAAERCYTAALRKLGPRTRPRSARVARAMARQNLGICLGRRGAVGRALREIGAAAAFFREAGLDRSLEMALHTRGWVHGVAGNALQALRDLQGAYAAFRDRGDDRHAALAELDEAEVRLRLGDFDSAADRARAAAKTLRAAKVPLEAARAELAAAQADLARGRRAAARRAAERAAATCRKASDRAGEALAWVLLGRNLGRAEAVLRRTGHWISALDALAARARSLSPATGAALLQRRVPQYPRALRAWLRPELLRLRAGRQGASRIPLLRRAFRAAEQLRLRAPTGTLRATSLAAQLLIYEEFAGALLERGRGRDLKEAFLVLDAARARTLREEMDREAPGIMDSPRVRKVRRRLEALWRTLERLDAGSGDVRGGGARLLHEVSGCERELVAAWRDAEASSTGAGAGTRLPEAPCLTFAALGRELIALLAADGGVHIWSCGPLARVREDMERLRFQVNRRLFGTTDAGPAQAVLDDLARRLLGGAPVDLRTDRLTAVLPAGIGSLPLEALPVAGRPLLATTRVAYAPFACKPPRSWRRTGETLLVGIEAQGLPEVAREVAFVRRNLKRTRVLRDRRATRDAILGSLSGLRLLHVAGHARTHEAVPPLSALRVRDGWVTAADLAHHPLRGALAVLSACRTGDPALLWRGESMGGFPRTLLAAGAAGIVASRWEIRDEAAYLWMRTFYRELANHAPDEALARAARLMLKRCPHPADWAGFLLIRSGAY